MATDYRPRSAPIADVPYWIRQDFPDEASQHKSHNYHNKRKSQLSGKDKNSRMGISSKQRKQRRRHKSPTLDNVFCPRYLPNDYDIASRYPKGTIARPPHERRALPSNFRKKRIPSKLGEILRIPKQSRKIYITKPRARSRNKIVPSLETSASIVRENYNQRKEREEEKPPRNEIPTIPVRSYTKQKSDSDGLPAKKRCILDEARLVTALSFLSLVLSMVTLIMLVNQKETLLHSQYQQQREIDSFRNRLENISIQDISLLQDAIINADIIHLNNTILEEVSDIRRRISGLEGFHQEITHLRARISIAGDLQTTAKNLENKINEYNKTCKHAIENSVAATVQLESKISNSKKSISDTLSNIKKLNEDITQIKDFLEGKKTAVMEFSERLHKAESHLSSLELISENTVKTIEKSRKFMTNSLQSMESNCTELQNKIRELKDQVLDAEKKIEMVDDYEEHLEGVEDDVRVLTSKMENLVTNVDVWKDEKKNYRNLEEEIHNVKSRVQDTQVGYQKLSQNLNEFNLTINKYFKSFQDHEEVYNDYHSGIFSELKNITYKISDLTENLYQLRSNFDYIDLQKYLELEQFEEFKRECTRRYEELNDNFDLDQFRDLKNFISRAVELELEFSEVSNTFEAMDVKLSRTKNDIVDIKKSEQEMGRDLKILTEAISRLQEDIVNLIVNNTNRELEHKENITARNVSLPTAISELNNAKESLRNVEELKQEIQKSIEVLSGEINDCRKSNTNTTEYIRQQDAKLERCISRIENIVAGLNADYEYAEASVTQCQNSVKDLAEDLSRKLATRGDTTKRNITFIKGKIQSIDKALDSIENKINVLKSASSSREEKHTQLESEINEMKSKLLEWVNSKHDVELLSFKVSNVSLTVDDLKKESEKERGSYIAEISFLKNELSELEEGLSELQSFAEKEIGYNDEDFERFRESFAEECFDGCESKITKLRGDLSNAISVIYQQGNSSSQETHNLQNKIKAILEEITEMKQKHDASIQEIEKSDLKILENISERYLTLSDAIGELNVHDLQKVVSNNSKATGELQANLKTLQDDSLGRDVITEFRSEVDERIEITEKRLNKISVSLTNIQANVSDCLVRLNGYKTKIDDDKSHRIAKMESLQLDMSKLLQSCSDGLKESTRISMDLQSEVFDVALQSEDRYLEMEEAIQLLADDVLTNFSSIHGRIMEVENALTYLVEEFTGIKQMGENLLKDIAELNSTTSTGGVHPELNEIKNSIIEMEQRFTNKVNELSHEGYEREARLLTLETLLSSQRQSLQTHFYSIENAAINLKKQLEDVESLLMLEEYD